MKDFADQVLPTVISPSKGLLIVSEVNAHATIVDLETFKAN